MVEILTNGQQRREHCYAANGAESTENSSYCEPATEGPSANGKLTQFEA